MQTRLLEETVAYDGSQLRSHWIYHQTGMIGDAIVVFSGPCTVGRDHMVDQMDLKNQAWIAGENMLHVIAEHFDPDLEKMILRQYLLIGLITDELHRQKPALHLERRGNDIFIGTGKLNVSIATASPVSTLMHVGINISSRNTPVPTCGLDDLKIDSRALARHILETYRHDCERIAIARCKVRGVS